MFKKSERTVESYLRTAAGMKLLRELLFIVLKDAYVVLPAPKCDSFHKRIENAIDTYRSLAEDLMFKDHKDLDGSYNHAFYGLLSSRYDDCEKAVAEKATAILDVLRERVQGGITNDPR